MAVAGWAAAAAPTLLKSVSASVKQNDSRQSYQSFHHSPMPHQLLYQGPFSRGSQNNGTFVRSTSECGRSTSCTSLIQLPHQRKQLGSHPSLQVQLVDGALVANNPSLVALQEAAQLLGKDSLASFVEVSYGPCSRMASNSGSLIQPHLTRLSHLSYGPHSPMAE
eukprot:GHVN01101220.1.p1 GENE.GHVN01101220.1~~GHVN01101220.1.p1  ORF type:complete len:165 (+),score=30.61 GHVN01101220.1:806-1300(+)